MKVLGILGAIVLAIGVWYMATYNGLINKREAVNGAWADVQTVYQRRADLVPNLVETVKGAANFEKSTLTAVTEARAKVGTMQVDSKVLNDPTQFHKFEQAQGELGRALSHLMAVSENYPNLKANENFRDLQSQIEGTENRIAVARRDFNGRAQDYNASIQRFPASVVAGGRFQPRPYFEAETGAEKAPKVKF
jgi:LemA protein